MSSLFLHVTKLTCVVWPIALNCNNFVHPMLMDVYRSGFARDG